MVNNEKVIDMDHCSIWFALFVFCNTCPLICYKDECRIVFKIKYLLNNINNFIMNLLDLQLHLEHRSLRAVAYQRVLHSSQDFHTLKPYISSKRLQVDTTLVHKTHCTVIFCSDLRQSLNADVKFTRTMAVAIAPMRWTRTLMEELGIRRSSCLKWTWLEKLWFIFRNK